MSCIFLLLERLATPVRGMAEIFSFGFIALRFLIDASLYKKNAKPYGLLVFVSALFPMPPASPSRRLGLCASYSAPWLSSAKLWLFRTIAFSSSSPCLLPGGSPQSLFSRAREGDIQGALQSLRIGARPLSRDGWGREMSHLAAAAGHSAFLLWSFEMGCSPRSRDIQGWTPAHHAAHRARPEALLAALSRGFDPGLLDSQGRSLAHLAALGGLSECVSIALAIGCDPFGADGSGNACADLAPAGSSAKALLLSLERSALESGAFAQALLDPPALRTPRERGL